MRAQYRAGRSLGHVVVAALTIDGGLVAHHQARRDRSPRADERRDGERVLEDLRSLCRAAQAFAEQVGSGASLTGFLEHAAGLHAQELPPGEDRRITVSTIHRAKGTEAALVIAARLRGAAAAVLARARVRRPRRPRGGTAAVLRRRHARQGPARAHPLPRPRRAPHRRPLALPRRGRPRHRAARARRLTASTRTSHGGHPMPDPHAREADGLAPPAATHDTRSRSSGARSRPARSAFAP